MARLTLTLFGAPQVKIDGRSVQIGREKAFALLAYLAATERPHRRDMLAALLWPDADQEHARGSLRRALSSLSVALPPGVLEVSQGTIALPVQDSVVVDVLEFRGRLAGCEEELRRGEGLSVRCIDLLGQAAALYADDFLSGFSVADCPEYEDWQRYEAESLRHDLFGVLEQLTAALTTLGDYEGAIRHLRRWVQMEPLAESAQYRLLQCYAQTGQLDVARRQYERYAELLEEETGGEPGRASTALYVAIKKGEIGLPERTQQTAAEPAAGAPSAGRVPAFLLEMAGAAGAAAPLCVGREDRLSQLYSYLAGALAGQGHVVFVTGEAGTGKTTLVREFLRRAMDDDADLVAAYGNCDAYAGIGDAYQPFRAVMGMLTGAVEEPWAQGLLTQVQAMRLWAAAPQAVADLLTYDRELIGPFVDDRALADRLKRRESENSFLASLGAGLPDGEMASNQAHLFERYLDWLRRTAARCPLLLVLDDLHWADISSVGLLFFLGRQIHHDRMLVIGTYRPEEVALGVSGRAHPLIGVREELRQVYGESEMSLDRSVEEEGRGFVDALLDASPNRLGEGFREQLFLHSRGHPLFTVELLHYMEEHGQLVRDADGYLAEGEGLAWDALPAKVEGVIAKRLSRLEGDLLETLSVASIEGEQFTAEVVAAVRGMDAQELVRRLSGDLAKRHRLVQASGTRRVDRQRFSLYRFSHNLFQQYLYQSLDGIERTYLHERVGLALEQMCLGRREELAGRAGQLARHFEAAELADKAVMYWQLAGDSAVRISANDEAVASFGRALAALRRMPDSQERAARELELQLSMGVPLAAVRGYSHPETAALYGRAVRLCGRTGQKERVFPALYGLWRYYLVRAQLQPAQRLAEQLLQLGERSGERDILIEAERAIGITYFHRGLQAEARAHMERVLSLYDQEQDHVHSYLFGHDPAVSCHFYLALSLWLLGYPDQALAMSRKGVELSARLDHPFSLCHSLLNGAAEVLLMRRDEAAARDAAEQALALALKHRFPQWVGFAQITLGAALSTLGQPKDGIAKMTEGLERLTSIDMGAHRVFFLACLAQGYARAGQVALMSEKLSSALNVAAAGGEHAWLAEVHRLQGEAALWAGANPAAVEAHLRTSLGVARQQQARSLELRSLTGLCRLWQAQGKGETGRRGLEQAYAAFDEGLDTADLREAKALLAEL